MIITAFRQPFGIRVERTRDRVLVGFLTAAILTAVPDADAQVLGSGDLTAAEQAFLRCVIFELRDEPLARLWIEARQKNASRTAEADLDYALADIVLHIRQDTEAYVELTSELARRWPTDRRSKAVELVAIKAAMARALARSREAKLATDATRKARLIAERDRIFANEVVKPIDRRVGELNTRIGGFEEESDRLATKGESPPEVRREGHEDDLRQRLEWEHYRLQAALLFASDLPEGSDEARRLYEETAARAATFVDSHFEDFAFFTVCDAQLIRGRALAAIGSRQEAAEVFETLVEIIPPVDDPDPALVSAILRLRLQALQGMGIAYNRGGEPGKAAEIFELVRAASAGPYALTRANAVPELLPFVLAAEIEEAIAQAAGAETEKGLRIFRRWIETFEDPGFRARDPERAKQFLESVSIGLSRLFDLGGGGLGPELCYRAGRGYKARGRFDAGIAAWKLALSRGAGQEEYAEWCARALFEIAETAYILDRVEESGLAFLLYLERYPHADSSQQGKAAQNAVAILTKLAQTRGGPWHDLVSTAEEFFGKHGRGIVAEQLKMQNAAKAEAEGRFEEARTTYLSVAKSVDVNGDETPVPYYYNARAGAARCLFSQGRTGVNGSGAREKAMSELEELDREAERSAEPDARAAARYALAGIYWHESHREADKARAALAPFMSAIRGQSEPRELGLRLLIQIHIHGQELDAAKQTFERLRADFTGGTQVAEAALELSDAYWANGDLPGAAELALSYTQLPAFKPSDQEVGVLSWLADRLIEGGISDAALPLLEQARGKLGSAPDRDLKIAVDVSFGKASLAAGKLAEAIRSFEGLLESYRDDIQRGILREAPAIYMQLAKAELQHYAQSPDATLIDNAEDHLSRAVGILQQRRRSLIERGLEVPPAMEYDFWWTWLHYLKTFQAQAKCEQVLKDIKTHRFMASDPNKFAPHELQKEFDKLEEECEKKKR